MQKNISKIGGNYIIPAKDFIICWHIDPSRYKEENEEIPDWMKPYIPFYESGIKEISIKRSKGRSLHYNLHAF